MIPTFPINYYLGTIIKGGYVLLSGLAVEAAIKAYQDGNSKGATSKFGRSLKRLKGKDGFLLAKGTQLNFDKTCENVLIIGPTGEKKSVSEYYTNLLTNHFPKSSIVIHDAKGELYKDTANYQRSIGRTPILFEPLGNSCSYNPLDFCEDITEVKELASNILQNGALAIKLGSGSNGGGSDATWINMCIPLFTAALMYVKDLKNEQSSISGAVKFLINTEPKDITLAFTNCNNPYVKEQYNMFTMALQSDATTGSILATFMSNVHLFTDQNLINNTTKSDFTPKMLRKKPIALYVKYEPLKSNYLAPFIAIFYSQIISKVMNYYNSRLLPVIFMLDEFQNLGKIADFSSIVSTCRYVKTPMIPAVQSLSRLYTIYGKNETDSILNNLKTKVILPSLSDVDNLRYVSDLCGYVQVVEIDGKRRFKTKKKLMEYDEVRRIPSDKLVIVAHNLHPLMCDQIPYYENAEMLKNKYLGGIDE